MKTTVRWAAGILAAVAALSLTTPAWSDDDRGDRRRHQRHDDRRDRHRGDWRRHDDRDHHRWRRQHGHGGHHWQGHHRHHVPSWHFHSGHGWRFQHRPGFWSPPFVWWWLDGRPHLRPLPVARIIRYPGGYYTLAGDGFRVPHHWVWRPTAVAVAPPPVPLPPPLPGDYPFPSYGYPAPPAG